MPAVLDGPANPTIYPAQYTDHNDGAASLPLDVFPHQVTLRDRTTVGTVVPFSSQHQIPHSLLAYLSYQMNKEIEMGDTYPMLDTMSVEQFASYWFQNFGAVMLLGNIESADEVMEGKNWATECLGSFYIRPNYPGRSSHICTAGFLVTEAARSKGVGRLMGETYLEWAPRLGYTYSVFNLVFETNVASCRIWDALGFKRIGRVKGAGSLKSHPGQLIDAIIYGRDLGPEGTDFASEERFDKIKYYLKYGKYPTGSDRAEKSRLRSAATHYKLLNDDKLMLKDKEVISDPAPQYEIAKNVHMAQHGGINKTTATIAEKYHWVRIKETVSLVIRNCADCKELGKIPVVRPDGSVTPRRPVANYPILPPIAGGVSAAGRMLSIPNPSSSLHQFQPHVVDAPGSTSVSPQVLNRTLPNSSHQDPHPHSHLHQQTAPIAPMSTSHHDTHHPLHAHNENDYMPLDPQIMMPEEAHLREQLGAYNHGTHVDQDDSFQALLRAQHGDGSSVVGEGEEEHGRRDSAADLDMLIEGVGEGDGEEGEDRMEMGDEGRDQDEHMPEDGVEGHGEGEEGEEARRRRRQVEEAARVAVEALRMGGND